MVARRVQDLQGEVAEVALQVLQLVVVEVGWGWRLSWPQVVQMWAAVLWPAGRGAGGHRQMV